MDASNKKNDFVGQTLLQYQVTERLGGGGLGVVSRAIDLKLKRTVALKFFPPSLTAGDEAKMRFVREMRSVSTLEHPNIGVLHALEETGDGRLFLVMAFYEGPTLAKRIDTGKIGVGEAVAVALQLLQGLGEAHNRGIVHGDLKPENLIFNALGVLKILDFGMAKFYGSPDLSPSSIPGTVAYFSPERAAGAPADVRSDLWSAGVILCEMLKARRLFKGTDANAIMASILADEPVSLAGLPSGLNRIVEKALERNPELRYQNAGEFVRDLELEQRSRLLFGSEEKAGPTATGAGAARDTYQETRTPTSAESSAPQGRWLLAAFAVVLLIAGGIFAWFHLRRPAPLPGVPLAMGRVRLLQERYPEAVNEFEQALAIDPTDEGAYHGLAQAYAAMGLTDKAEEALRSDIALHPASSDAYDQLAKFELNRGNSGAAVANFRAALKFAPQDPAILSDLGAALAHSGSFDESRRVLEQSIHLAPSFSAWNNLGDLDLKQRHFADAATDYTKALEFNNSDYHIWADLGAAYARTPQQKEKAKDAFARAARLCREALQPRPNDPILLSDLAAILAAQPDGREEAQTLIKRAQSLAPDDSHVQCNAAQTYAELGRRKIALGLLEKILSAGYPTERINAIPVLADLMKSAPGMNAAGMQTARTSHQAR
ncbi:MAG TPA: tetratricopeptide repeat protein [Terracidiphilus sp.]